MGEGVAGGRGDEIVVGVVVVGGGLGGHDLGEALGGGLGGHVLSALDGGHAGGRGGSGVVVGRRNGRRCGGGCVSAAADATMAGVEGSWTAVEATLHFWKEREKEGKDMGNRQDLRRGSEQCGGGSGVERWSE